MISHERKPLTNKALTGQYSPGSTFKMIVALAALEARAVNAQTRVFCSGRMFLGNHAFHCWRREGHGSVNVISAIAVSCDIFFYEAAQRIGIERIAEMSRRFGLGSRIDIGLDNEAPGLIPDREWKLRRIGEPWQQGETLIAGIGQGYILTTPLQLATMMARLVNGGYEVQPTLILQDEPPPKARKINISKAYLDLMKEGMYDVVNSEQGTARASRFNYNGQKMGGKTGTTQVRRISMRERETGVLRDHELPWRLRNHALFVGYAPHDNPRYGVAVLVEHGGGGSAVAAPIARNILLEAVKLDPTKRTLE
jgi:penicillin-binding protein 2